MNFQINDEQIDADTHVIELGGEIDLYTAPEFARNLAIGNRRRDTASRSGASGNP